jgi:acyl carrier protein
MLTTNPAGPDSQIIHKVQVLLLEKLSIRVESVEEDLFEAGVLDSVALVRLLAHLEEECGVLISMDELGDTAYSIANIASALGKRQESNTHESARM